MRRLLTTLTGLGLAMGLLAAPVAAGGPPHVGFYADGALYRTIGTPTDFSGTGAPESSYDAIYVLGGELTPVAESKPGDQDFNGGRWAVRLITWNVDAYQLVSGDAVEAAATAGDLSIGDPIAWFECPVIRLAPGH